MRHATFGLAQAVFLTPAMRGIHWLIDRTDDFRYRDLGRTARQGVAAARATGRFDQFVTAQFAKQLFQIRQGDRLALADGGQSDRATALTQAQVDHGGDRKTAFGSKSHHMLLQSVWLTNGVKYSKKPSNLLG